MPTVRRYNSPQVRQAPLPGVRISPDAPRSAFQGSQPVDISPITNLAAQMREEEIEKADQLAILDADGKMSKFETDALYGENGVLNREGQNAFGSPEEIQEAWGKTVSEIDKGLKSDRQKMAFRKSVEQRWQSVNNTVQRHVATERKRYDDQTTKSFLENERNAAVANFSDPERVGLSIQRQTEAIKGFASRNGLSGDALEAAVSDAVSKTHMGVINRMEALDQDLAASAYYQKHKEQIAGTDRVKVEQSLQEGSVRGESQRQVDIIVKKHTNRTDALDAAAAIESPLVREAAEKRINWYFDQRKEAQRESADALFQQASNMLKPGRLAQSSVPVHVWNALEPGQKRALQILADEQSGSGGSASSAGNGLGGGVTMYDFLSMEPEEIGNLNKSEFYSRFYSKLGKQDRSRALTAWNNARKAKEGGKPQSQKSSFTLKDQIDNALRTSKLVGSGSKVSLSNDEKRLVSITEREVEESRQRFIRDNGKGPNAEQERAMVDAAVLRRAFPASKADEIVFRVPGDVGRFKKTGDGGVKVSYNEIPQKQRSDLEARLKRNTGNAPRDKVERAYALWVLGDVVGVKILLGER